MDKTFLNELKEQLEKNRLAIEEELKKIAKEDKSLPGDWDTRFPKFGRETSHGGLEAAADEVEEYATLLPIEYNLELRLKAINRALEKIKKGQYGKCENCGREINERRLKIYPEAKFCLKCQE